MLRRFQRVMCATSCSKRLSFTYFSVMLTVISRGAVLDRERKAVMMGRECSESSFMVFHNEGAAKTIVRSREETWDRRMGRAS